MFHIPTNQAEATVEAGATVDVDLDSMEHRQGRPMGINGSNQWCHDCCGDRMGDREPPKPEPNAITRGGIPSNGSMHRGVSMTL